MVQVGAAVERPKDTQREREREGDVLINVLNAFRAVAGARTGRLRMCFTGGRFELVEPIM